MAKPTGRLQAWRASCATAAVFDALAAAVADDTEAALWAADEAFARAEPDLVMHLAAESHVDRSIDAPGDFVTTNLVGTFRLLEAARFGQSLTSAVAHPLATGVFLAIQWYALARRLLGLKTAWRGRPLAPQ
jgi:hypothetical protein